MRRCSSAGSSRCRRCSWRCRLKAGLAEGGRLLVARVAGDRDRAAEPLVRRLAVDFARRADFRQHGAGNIENGQQFVVPIERVDVEQQRAAGVAQIGDVASAAGEPPEEPRIDGAEEDLASLGSVAEPIVRVQADA